VETEQPSGTGQPLIRVVVVDDHKMFLEGAIELLDASAGIQVVASGSSGQQAVELAERHSPDVILLDIRMAGGGIAAAEQITRRFPSVKVGMLTASVDCGDFSDAMRNGATGYIVKGISGSEFIEAVTLLSAGKTYLSDGVIS